MSTEDQQPMTPGDVYAQISDMQESFANGDYPLSAPASGLEIQVATVRALAEMLGELHHEHRQLELDYHSETTSLRETIHHQEQHIRQQHREREAERAALMQADSPETAGRIWAGNLQLRTRNDQLEQACGRMTDRINELHQALDDRPTKADLDRAHENITRLREALQQTDAIANERDQHAASEAELRGQLAALQQRYEDGGSNGDDYRAWIRSALDAGPSRISRNRVHEILDAADARFTRPTDA